MKPSILISCSCFARYKSTKEMAQLILLQRCLMVKDKQNLPKEKHPKEKRPKVEVVMGMEMVLEERVEEMEIGVVMEERVEEMEMEEMEEMEEMDLIQKVKMKTRKRMRRRKKKKIHIYQHLLVRRAHQRQNGGPRATRMTISFKKRIRRRCVGSQPGQL